MFMWEAIRSLLRSDTGYLEPGTVYYSWAICSLVNVPLRAEGAGLFFFVAQVCESWVGGASAFHPGRGRATCAELGVATHVNHHRLADVRHLAAGGLHGTRPGRAHVGTKFTRKHNRNMVDIYI